MKRVLIIICMIELVDTCVNINAIYFIIIRIKVLTVIKAYSHRISWIGLLFSKDICISKEERQQEINIRLIFYVVFVNV